MNTYTRELRYDVICSTDLREAIFSLCQARGCVDIRTGSSGPRLDCDYRVIPGQFRVEVMVTGDGAKALYRLLRKHNAHEVGFHSRGGAL